MPANSVRKAALTPTTVHACPRLEGSLGARHGARRCSASRTSSPGAHVIWRRSVRLDAGKQRPERRSDDGQTILRSIQMGRNRILTWHFMWSYGDSNPGPSCMPSAGSTSTAVPLCRSPSQSVRTIPVRSAPVADFPAVPVSLPGQAPKERLTSQNLEELCRGALQGDQHPTAPDQCRKAPEAVPRLRPRPLPLPHSRQPEILTTSHRRVPRSPESGRPRPNARTWLSGRQDDAGHYPPGHRANCVGCIGKARSVGPRRRSRAHWTPGCSGHRHGQDRHRTAEGPTHLQERAACATTWPGAGRWRRRKTPPLWWTDGVGQADPGHLRLRRT